MSRFQTERETAVSGRRDAASPRAFFGRRGPVIRASDFSPRPGSLLDEPEITEEAQHPAPLEIHENIQQPVRQPLPAVEVSRPVIEPVNQPRPIVAEASPAAPLIDTRSVMRAIWKHKMAILICAVLGALVGGMLTPLIPRKFSAATSLYFDPRQIELSDSSAQTQFNKDAFLAVIDSQIRILTSGHVLEKVATSLGLDNDPSFGGGAGAASLPLVVAGLQKSLKVEREDNTYIVNLSVTAKDPAKAADIANQVVTSFLQEEDSASSGLYRDTNTVLDGRLDMLGKKLQDAEKAVETYKADNGMVTAEGGLIADKRLLSLNELLVTAQNKTIEAKARADAASRMRFEDMVAGSLPDDVSSVTLAELRRQYGAMAANVKSLESQLGARHPQLAAARASLDSLSAEIRRELQRFASVAQAELQQAQKAEADVAKELAVQKAAQSNTSIRQVDLNELQRRAAAARDIYEAMLKRTQQTSEDQNLTKNNIRIISRAEPALKADGPGFGALLMATVFAGLLGGLGLGIVYAIVRMLAAHPFFHGYLAESVGPDRAVHPQPHLDSNPRSPSITQLSQQAEYDRRWRKRL